MPDEAQSTDSESQSSLLAPLQHRDFRVFWIGLFISGMGSQFTTVAMAWQIYELTNSPFQIGLIGLARAVPQIVLLLLGGLLADAVNRRRLMLCTQAGLCTVSTLLAWLSFHRLASAMTLYAATAFLAVFNSLEAPARQAIVPSLVPREQLPKALALHSSQRYVAVIAGPSLAGLVLAFLGAAACYAIDALSWLAMLVSLLFLRTRLQEGKGWEAVSLHSLREGFRFVSLHAIIFPLMILDFGATFFGSAKALFPIYARDILSVGPQGLGLLYAANAAGALLVAVTMSLFGEVRRAGIWILIGVGVYGVCTCLFAGSQLFWLSVLLLAGAGAGNMISSILRGTINQLSTPDALRGRMASINSLFTSSGPQLGQFESGVVAAWLGTELSALTGGLATLIILAGVALWFPGIRRFEIREVAPGQVRTAVSTRAGNGFEQY
ncbi:MAG TPA: MFS transporter [Candidatus Binatia bacterium]|nr:MFS transporter [Candidatus Binatia bacterium]